MTDTSVYRHRRATDATSEFPLLEPGEIAVNTYSGQLAVGDDRPEFQGQPIPMLAIVNYLDTAIYLHDALVTYQGQVWRCQIDGTTGSWQSAKWEQITGQQFSKGVFNPTQVLNKDYVAQPNDWCRVDTREHYIEISLGKTPLDGSSVRITDVGCNFVNNPCYVIGDGQTINGVKAPLDLQNERDVILLFTEGLGWVSV